MKSLKDIAPLKRTGTEIKRLSQPTPHRSQKLFGWLDPPEDPLKGVPQGLSPEEDFKAITDTLDSKLAKDRQRQKELFDLDGRTDNYCVICFEECEQLTAFLTALGYPHPGDNFIDGHLLAERMNIQIPETKLRLRPIRRPDRTLSQLVTERPSRLRV